MVRVVYDLGMTWSFFLLHTFLRVKLVDVKQRAFYFASRCIEPVSFTTCTFCVRVYENMKIHISSKPLDGSDKIPIDP